MNLSIKVENLSKSYRLYKKPTDRLFEILWPLGKKRYIPFEALTNINFSLEKGQSLGIVGRNGSGKSTLLKILAGILTPSSGNIFVDGRIGSLLELGGGFNVELSGRENAEMQLMLNNGGKCDDDLLKSTIEFAAIGDFIDHPVKKYSSGMFMRLAFACATAISPQILIVDEALAVGDAYFVKKCMSRMHTLMEAGTTLLFVSHDLESIRRLCDKAIFLDCGHQMGFGTTREIAEQYTAFLRGKDKIDHEISHDIERKSYNFTRDRQLFNVEGKIDVAEQRIFLEGYWPWYTDIKTGISARYTPSGGGSIAFQTTGNRMTLSFLRGNGFELPDVLIDNKSRPPLLENDVPFLNASTTPFQVRNYIWYMEYGSHQVHINANDKITAFVGGECLYEMKKLKCSNNEDWEKNLPADVVVYGDRKAVITGVDILNFEGKPLSNPKMGDIVRLHVHAQRLDDVKNVSIGYKIHNSLSVGIFGTSTREENYSLNDDASSWTVEFSFNLPLFGGRYTISAAITSVDGVNNIMHHYIDIVGIIYLDHYQRRSVWGEIYNPTMIKIEEYY